MTSLRPLTEDGFGPKKVVVLSEDGEPLRGPSGKIRYRLWAGDKPEFLKQRQAWLDLQNRHLALAGLDIRVDGRSHEERGLGLATTTHIGVGASAMVRNAEGSGKVQQTHGNALIPWFAPAFLFHVVGVLAQGLVLIVKKNPHRSAVQVFQLPTAHAPKKRKQSYNAHTKRKHNQPDQRLVHGGHPGRPGHMWQMARIASFLQARNGPVGVPGGVAEQREDDHHADQAGQD